MATIRINTITTAIDALVRASQSYQAALEIVRDAAQSGRLERDQARLLLTTAVMHHMGKKYAGQCGDDGLPLRNTALTKYVSEMLRDIFTAEKSSAADEKAEIIVPAEIMAAALKLAKLCAQYEGEAKLASTALAQARAELKK
jgi:hypothetical protein